VPGRGGDNQLLNQVIMQAPDVARTRLGSFHVRGEHNGLQYPLERHHPAGGYSASSANRLIAPDFLAHPLVTGSLARDMVFALQDIDLKTKSG